MIIPYLGIDECGNGALAGPLVVCGVIPGDLFPGVGDSKTYSPRQREQIAPQVSKLALDTELVWLDNKDIDSMGMNNAWQVAVRTVIQNLRRRNGDLYTLIDGNKIPDGEPNCGSLIHGDALDEVIGAASVLAKVSRDAYMVEMGVKYPGYLFEKHKGYGTPEHIRAVKKLGPCPLHRALFLRKILGERE